MGHGEYPRVTKVFVMAVRGMDLYAAWLKYRRHRGFQLNQPMTTNHGRLQALPSRQPNMHIN